MILTQNRWFCSECSYLKNSALNLFANLSQTQSKKYKHEDVDFLIDINITIQIEHVMHKMCCIKYKGLLINLHFSAHPSLLLSSTKFLWIVWFYYSNNEDVSNKMTVKRWPFRLNLTHLKTRLWQLLSQG